MFVYYILYTYMYICYIHIYMLYIFILCIAFVIYNTQISQTLSKMVQSPFLQSVVLAKYFNLFLDFLLLIKSTKKV